ncbi:hypothetical protein COLO4_03452 [Corchorus olitorius]|uniref:F-box/LRR-repeat protein 15/At3g58940/PEG3-like LRR domain-containing protein n=1 Tax=Corchorus olitorius TaxID=93759 RepID=A0A1R3KYI7_9ROSI|nr:hypothetical protein COLO4_03452 [Corchorus olitorius]
MSFLDVRDAVQTCILSKRWLSLWKSPPYLHFCCPVNDDSYNYTKEEKARILRHYPGFIICFIAQRYSTNLAKVRLDHFNHFKMIPGVVQCLLCHVVQHNVRELEIRIFSDHIAASDNWVWPGSFYNCQSLTDLTLESFNSRYDHCNSIQLPKYLGMPALRSLHLIRFVMTEDNFDPRIFSSCPNLETLHLYPCEIAGLKILRIQALNLKKFCFMSPTRGQPACHIEDRCKLEIHAPLLTTLDFRGYGRIVQATESFASIDDVSLDMEELGKNDFSYLINTFKDIRHARSLTLSSNIVEVLSMFTALLDEYQLKFPNLEYLKLILQGHLWNKKMQVPLHVLNCLANSSTLLDVLSMFPALLDEYQLKFANLKYLKLTFPGDKWQEKLQVPLHVLNCLANSSTLLEVCKP